MFINCTMKMKTTAKGILNLKRKMEKLLIIISFSLLNDKWHKSTDQWKIFSVLFSKITFYCVDF